MAKLAERRKELLNSMMKEAIYEAAVTVLTEHGLDGVTMERVAEEAEAAKGSLYHYFRNKLELLQFVHDKTIEPMKKALHQVAGSERPAGGKLKAIVRTWFQYLEQHRGLFNFLFNDYAVRELLKCQEKTSRAFGMRHVAGIIEQGIEEGAFRRVDPTRAAEMLLGAVRETGERQLDTDAPWPAEELADAVMDVFLHGVAACPPVSAESS